MLNFVKAKRFILAILIMSINLFAGACTMTSPMDQAYYTNSDVFAFKGGYTRTIFSTTNF